MLYITSIELELPEDASMYHTIFIGYFELYDANVGSLSHKQTPASLLVCAFVREADVLCTNFI